MLTTTKMISYLSAILPYLYLTPFLNIFNVYPYNKASSWNNKKEKKKDGKEVKKLNMRKDRERTSCVQVQSSQFSSKEGKTWSH